MLHRSQRKEPLRLWGFDRDQCYITSDGARYRDCNTEKDVLSGLYLCSLERLIPAQDWVSAKLGFAFML